MRLLPILLSVLVGLYGCGPHEVDVKHSGDVTFHVLVTITPEGCTHPIMVITTPFGLTAVDNSTDPPTVTQLQEGHNSVGECEVCIENATAVAC